MNRADAVEIDASAVPCLHRRDTDDYCWHRGCKLATLPPAIAARLARNDEARDWLANWGKLVYDRERHGRDAKRRRAAAAIVRAMRAGAGYADAVRAGAWAGAAM